MLTLLLVLIDMLRVFWRPSEALVSQHVTADPLPCNVNVDPFTHTGLP